GQAGDINPSFNPAEGLDPDAFGIPIVRTGGVTTGFIIPNGNFLPGQAVGIDYSGAHAELMIVRSPAALVVNLTAAAREAGGGTRAGALGRLRRIFQDALEYDRRRADYRRAAAQPFAAPAEELEAVLPALRRRLPAIVFANRKLDLDNALKLAREFKLKLILASAVEGWKIAPAIAAAGVPVLLEPNHDIPSFDGLAARLDNVTLLRQAGVKVVIAQGDPGG